MKKGTSKIAQFPRHIRDELNRRLDNGQNGKPLLDWLNSLPEVQEILRKDFEGQPVNTPNLPQLADDPNSSPLHRRISAR